MARIYDVYLLISLLSWPISWFWPFAQVKWIVQCLIKPLHKNGKEGFVLFFKAQNTNESTRISSSVKQGHRRTQPANMVYFQFSLFMVSSLSLVMILLVFDWLHKNGRLVHQVCFLAQEAFIQYCWQETMISSNCPVFLIYLWVNIRWIYYSFLASLLQVPQNSKKWFLWLWLFWSNITL